MEDDMLILEIEALNVKIKGCLKILDEKIAMIQGFGRLARQTVELQKKDEGYYFIFSGISFKKMQECNNIEQKYCVEKALNRGDTVQGFFCWLWCCNNKNFTK